MQNRQKLRVIGEASADGRKSRRVFVVAGQFRLKEGVREEVCLKPDAAAP